MAVDLSKPNLTDRAITAASHIRALISTLIVSGDERSTTQRAALIAFAVRVLSAALLYVSQVLMARWMGTFDYGIYVFAWTWVLVLGGLSHCGLNLGAIRLVSQYRELQQHNLERGLLIHGRLVAIGVSTALAAAAGSLLYVMQDLLANHYVLPLALALFCIPMIALSDVNDGIGRANGWMVAGLVPPYVLRPLFLILAMATLHFAGVETDALAAIGAAIFATWAASLVQVAMIWRAMPEHLQSGDREIDIQGWAKMSLPMLLISACEMVLQYADVLIVGYYLPPEQVGIYFAAAKTMALILFVQYAVGSAAAKSYAGHHARGDTEALARAVRDSVHWTFWPSLGCALLILALGKPILSLFGAEFVSGYGVMLILVVGFLMRAAMGPAEFLLNMAGEQVAGARIYMFTAALNIALNFALIPLFGLYGAAAATATATSVAAVLCAIVAHRKLGLRIAIWSNMSAVPDKSAPDTSLTD